MCPAVSDSPEAQTSPSDSTSQKDHVETFRVRAIPSDAELKRLRQMLAQVESESPSYVMFNNLPRIANAKTSVRMTDEPETDFHAEQHWSGP
jgi:uncharacterized protein YecE (DUF72 family)